MTDKSEQANEQLWNEICSRLRRYYLEHLGNLPFGHPCPKIYVDGHKRLEYVQSLCALFPVQEVWNKYQALRIQQFETIIKPHKQGKHNEKLTFSKGILQLEVLANQMLTMIKEEFELFNSGLFTSVTSTFKAIHEIYLERFGDEIGHVTEILHEEVSTGQKEMPKSTSEFGRISHLKGQLKKQHSRSLDNLTGKSDEQPFTELQVAFYPFFDKTSFHVDCGIQSVPLATSPKPLSSKIPFGLVKCMYISMFTSPNYGKNPVLSS